MGTVKRNNENFRNKPWKLRIYYIGEKESLNHFGQPFRDYYISSDRESWMNQFIQHNKSHSQKIMLFRLTKNKERTLYWEYPKKKNKVGC